MGREAELDLAARGNDDDWFDEGSRKPSGVQRERRVRLVLGVTLAALVILGIALGAFSSHEPAPGPDLVRLRARAQEASQPSAMQAGGNEALLAGLARLAAAMPEPEPVADVVAAPDAASEATDAVAVVEADAVAVAAVEPAKPREVKEPKEAKEPKETKEKEPKVLNALGIPSLEPKVDPKATPEKSVDDPKLKAPLDQALADAKAHLDSGRWSEAKVGYEKVLALSPGNTRALLGRGRASLELKQVQPALKDIKAVLEAEPRNPTALLLAGSISQELGQKDQARGFYQRYLDAWPSGRKAAEVKSLLERM